MERDIARGSKHSENTQMFSNTTLHCSQYSNFHKCQQFPVQNGVLIHSELFASDFSIIFSDDNFQPLNCALRTRFPLFPQSRAAGQFEL